MLKILKIQRKNANHQRKQNDWEKTEYTKAIKNEIGCHVTDHHHYKTHPHSIQHRSPFLKLQTQVVVPA